MRSTISLKMQGYALIYLPKCDIINSLIIGIKRRTIAEIKKGVLHDCGSIRRMLFTFFKINLYNTINKKEHSMDKIFKSKIFVIITPIITFILFLISGWLVSYLPHTSGRVYGTSVVTRGSTITTYRFRINNAIGIWLIGLAISLLVLLICVLIRKVYLCSKTKIEE